MKNAAILSLLWYCTIPIIHSQILINEFYADVATGDAGDANGDGIRNAREDEFIEIVNPTDETISIKGYTIWVADVLRHEFKETLSNYSSIVVFGGGDLTRFGSSFVLASSGSLGLGNSGAKVELKNPQGKIIEEFIYPDEDNDSSWTRDPDITGGFKSHYQVVAAYGMPFSPGTLTNGFPFNSSTTTLVQFHQPDGLAIEGDSLLELPIYLINPSSTESTFVTVEFIGGSASLSDNFFNFNSTIEFSPNEQGLKFFPIPIVDDNKVEHNEGFLFDMKVEGGNRATVSLNGIYTLALLDNDFDFPLVLNEIHADPALTLTGDANGDGSRDAKEDEFVEFINTSEEVIDLSNFQIWDEDAMRHQIPEGTFIAPEQAYVVFGGGTPSGNFGNAVVQTASTGTLNLANEGDKIIIHDTANTIVYAFAYGSEAADNQSITRCPDIEGELISPHSTVGNGALYSPGKIKTEEVTTDATNLSLEKEVILFPNPSNGVIYVNSSIPFHKIELLTLDGKTLFTTIDSQINISLESGVYLVKIHTDSGGVVKKVSAF